MNPRTSPVKKIFQSRGQFSGCKIAPDSLLNGLYNHSFIKYLVRNEAEAVWQRAARFGSLNREHLAVIVYGLDGKLGFRVAYQFAFAAGAEFGFL